MSYLNFTYDKLNEFMKDNKDNKDKYFKSDLFCLN